MFHTFNIQTPKTPKTPKPRSNPPTAASSDGDNESSSRKRQKISRACDRCRTFRIKCGEKPCAQCAANKAQCVTSANGPNSQKPKWSALMRPEKEPKPSEKPRQEWSSRFEGSKMPPTPASSSPGSVDINTRLRLDGYYGLDRPIYFFAKIDTFFAQSRATWDSSAKAHMTDNECLGLGPFPTLPHPPVFTPHRNAASENLTADQQTYFLRLFWEAYHPVLQVPNESEFRALYNFEWQQVTEERPLTNALVNCLTALGLQYGHSAGRASRILSLQNVEVSGIADEYFRRCRDLMLMNTELTVAAMQCHTLMALYLMNASNFKDAYDMLGTVIRKAHSANLHREPKDCPTAQEKASRRRVWWLLFMLDIRCSHQLGKPIAVQPSAISCALPSNNELPIAAGYSRKEMEMSTCFIQSVKLSIAVAEIDRLVSTSEMCEDASSVASLEQRAERLASASTHLEKWRRGLPSELLNARRGTGRSDSLSTAENPIVLEMSAPKWLHRQRVLLEVHYHNAYIILQRPFICFPRALNFSHIQQPQTDQHARSSLQHAISMTTIVHGVCSTSDVLYGWPEILQPLWNATVTMLAFVLANPICTLSSGARQSICKALTVFEAFAATDPLAARAKEITQSLVIKLDSILTNLDDGTNETYSNDTVVRVNEAQQFSNGSSNLVSADLVNPSVEFPTNELLAPDLEDILFSFRDDSLSSWMGALDYDTQRGYTNGPDNLLGTPDLDPLQGLEKSIQ